MVNFKETLTKIHKEFPEFDLEKLLKIMECIVEEPQFNLNNNGNYILNRDQITRYPWDQITCTYKDDGHMTGNIMVKDMK